MTASEPSALALCGMCGEIGAHAPACPLWKQIVTCPACGGEAFVLHMDTKYVNCKRRGCAVGVQLNIVQAIEARNAAAISAAAAAQREKDAQIAEAHIARDRRTINKIAAAIRHTPAPPLPTTPKGK